LLACIVGGVAVGKQPRPATGSELQSLVGEELPHPIKPVQWKAGEPPKTNLLIYALQPATYSPDRFKSLAAFLGVRGEPQKLPPTILYAPGYWIKEPNPTNKETWKALIFSEISGMVRFDSGEDNHRWDLKNKRPLVREVPGEKEALHRTLAMLSVLGVTTNDLEHLPDGQLRYTWNTDGTWYNDRHDNWQRKRYVRQLNIELWQRIQDGASVLSIGGGGMLRAGYISEGHLAEIEMTFRNFKSVGTASPKSGAELVRMLQRGEARSFRASIPDRLTVTQCSLVYPQANSTTKQDFLWPCYSLKAESIEAGETNSFYIYVPLVTK
jgi:hypothetical protein